MRKLATATLIAVFIGAIGLAACGQKQTQQAQEKTEEEKEQLAEEASAEADAITEEAITEAEEMEDEVLADFVGEIDLAGSWQDEVSQRASMDITVNDDGSCDIYVHWGGSATETAIWQIHGTYDPTSGMLTYEDGAYSIHTFDGDKETVSGEETTQGTFMKEGDKLRWSDSKNEDDCVFVKM